MLQTPKATLFKCLAPSIMNSSCLSNTQEMILDTLAWLKETHDMETTAIPIALISLQDDAC